MSSGHITIQYMFCMYFMIKKIILEGFNDRGGANVRGRRGENFKKTKKTKEIYMVFSEFRLKTLENLECSMILY